MLDVRTREDEAKPHEEMKIGKKAKKARKQGSKEAEASLSRLLPLVTSTLG